MKCSPTFYADPKKSAADNGYRGDAFNIYPLMATQNHNFDDYTHLKINPQGCNTIQDSLLNYWFISPQSYCTVSTACWRVTMLYNKDFHIVLDTDSGAYKINLTKVKI